MSSREDGFSIVETLVAVIVVSSVSLALTQALFSARSMAAESRVRSEALQIAQLGLEISRQNSSPTELATQLQGTDQLWQLEEFTDPRSGLTRYEIRVPWSTSRKSGEVRLVTFDWEGRTDAQ